jgi:hypothetical protein
MMALRKRMDERRAAQEARAAEESARAMQLEDFKMAQLAALQEKTPELISALSDAKRADAEALSMATGEPTPEERAKAVVETGPDGKKKTTFEGTQAEVLDQLRGKASQLKGRERPLDQPTELVPPEMLQTLPSAAALSTTPEGTPEAIPLLPTEAPPTEVMPERKYGTLDLFGLEDPVPLENRQEMLERIRQESLVQPNVMAAMANLRGRKTTEEEMALFEWKEQIKAKYKGDGAKDRWEVRSVPGHGLVRINPDTGEFETVIQAGTELGRELKAPSEKLLGEMRDMRTLAKKTVNLAKLPSDYKFAMAKWTPDFIRNVMAEELEGQDDKFFSQYQQFDPAYFMFTAELLKSIQGSRPSDKDMEWYLQNMPRIDDRGITKATKINWLLGQLGAKYNSTVETYSPYIDMRGFEPMTVPSADEILAQIQGEDEQATATEDALLKKYGY